MDAYMRSVKNINMDYERILYYIIFPPREDDLSVERDGISLFHLRISF